MPANHTHILYLSYDGMTDPLGRSQVIPYLEGLSRAGYIIHLVSFEKTRSTSPEFNQIRLLLGQQGIYWTPLSYTKYPPVLSTIYDLNRMISVGQRLIRQHGIKLVHCRSYISGLAGLKLKKKTGAAFLFDMRGFWADERVDGKLWDLKKTLYKKIYDYFKQKEKEMLREADGVISLTNAGKQVIDSWSLRTAAQLPVEVIPCCADLEFFNPAAVNQETVSKFKTELEIKDKQFVISYLGAIGTWYMLDEMLVFFKQVLAYHPNAIFLFITREPSASIFEAAFRMNIPKSSIRIRPGKRDEIPALLSLSHVSLFFIIPTFSKTASSPTKQGEIMGMGIPVICNSGIGDTDQVVKKYNSGLVIDLSDATQLQKAAARLSELQNLDPQAIREGAFDFYSLKEGVEKYKKIYRQILQD